MPDIAKCANEACERKNKCYRYTCEPSEYWQSYGQFNAEGCEHFIDNDRYDRSKKG